MHSLRTRLLRAAALALLLGNAGCGLLRVESRAERAARREAQMRLWAIEIARPDLRTVTLTHNGRGLELQHVAYLADNEIVLFELRGKSGPNSWSYARLYLSGGRIFACSTQTRFAPGELSRQSAIREVEVVALVDRMQRVVRQRWIVNGKPKRAHPDQIRSIFAMYEGTTNSVREDLLASGDLLP